MTDLIAAAVTEDATYLFEHTAPVHVAQEWFDMLGAITSIEDETFILPWNES